MDFFSRLMVGLMAVCAVAGAGSSLFGVRRGELSATDIEGLAVQECERAASVWGLDLEVLGGPRHPERAVPLRVAGVRAGVLGGKLDQIGAFHGDFVAQQNSARNPRAWVSPLRPGKGTSNQQKENPLTSEETSAGLATTQLRTREFYYIGSDSISLKWGCQCP